MPLVLIFCLFSLATLAIVHIASIEFSLYWKYLWLDIPVHFLGGVAVVFGFASLPFFRIYLRERYTTFLPTIFVVFCIGVIWELFELLAGVSQVDAYFWGDTLLDLALDVLGGAVGYGIKKKIETL